MIPFRELLKYFFPPVLVLIIHIFLVPFGIYYLYDWIDIPMHFIGGLSVAITFTLVLKSLQRNNLLGKMNYMVFLVFVVSLTALTAVIWEFWEFLADVFVSLGAQLGIADTMLDLFLGIIGGLFGFLFTYKSLKKSSY